MKTSLQAADQERKRPRLFCVSVASTDGNKTVNRCGVGQSCKRVGSAFYPSVWERLFPNGRIWMCGI